MQLVQGKDKVADLKPFEQSGKQLKEHFEAGVTQIESYVQGVEPRCLAIVNQYNQLVDNLNTVSQDVVSGCATAEDIKGKAYYMNEMGKLVSSYNDNLSGMSKKMSSVESVLAEVKVMKEKVTGSQNLVNDSSQQAFDMWNKSKEVMQSIGDSNTDFSQTMKDGIRDVQAAMVSLEDKLATLDKVGKLLADAWDRSSKQRAL